MVFSAPFLLVELFPAQLDMVVDKSLSLVFHNTVEFFSIMVSLSVFSVGWSTHDQSKDRHALFLGVAFLAVGLLDFMHTMSNAAMPAFLTPNSTNKSTQFWVMAQLFNASTLLASAFISPASPSTWLCKRSLLPAGLMLTGLVFVAVVFFPSSLPATAVQGAGFTPLKRKAEFLVILLLATAAVAYWRRMRRSGDRALIYYPVAFILYIFSEGAFASSRTGFDTYGLLGHVYKVAAFYLIYKGVFIAAVKAPYEKLENAEQARHLASFPHLNPDPILEVKASGEVTFANPATRKSLESLGLAGTEAEAFIPKDLNEVLGSWNGKEDRTLHREIELQGRVFDETIFLTSQFEVARIHVHDVTERKRMEAALKEGEQRVRRKLKSILFPEGDIGALDLADVIDAAALQSLLEDFYALTRLPMGLMDLKGKVLVGVGWQEACTKFHRLNPEARRNCIESDLQLTAGVPHGEYKIYKCKNNMWGVATPVMIGDRHFGNLFMGQFFFENEPLDYELFRSQAAKFGFDEKEYIAALEAVPRLSSETLATSMSFFMKLAGLLSQLSYSNIKLARLVGERDTLMQSLRQQEEWMGFFIEYAPASLAMFDRDMRYMYGSRRWKNDYGLGDRDLRGLSHYEVFPDIPAQWREAHRRGLAGEVLRVEADRFQRADGSEQWLRWEIRPWKDAVGEVGGIVIFTENITDRKLAEAALFDAKRALEQERDLLQHVMNGAKNSHLVYLDRAFNFVRVNETYAQSCGYRPEQMIGKNHFALYPHPENEAIFSRVRDTGEEEAYHDKPFEFPDQPERGVTYWDWTLSPVKDSGGKVTGLVFSLFETTARKKAEEELRQKEERLRLALAAARMASWDWHVPSGEVVWNDMHYRMMGYEPGAVRPSYQAWASRVHPEDIDAVERMIRQAMAERRVYTTEFRTLWPDGTIRWLEVRGEFDYDADDQPSRCYGVMLDISERKETEEALHRQSLALEAARVKAENDKRLLTAVMDALPTAVAITDVRGGNIQANSAFERIWSGPRPLTQSVADYAAYKAWWADTGLPVAVEEWASALALKKGETVAGQLLRIQRFDGSEAYVINSAAPIRDAEGTVVGSAVAIQDITALKRTEKALRESEALYRAIGESIDYGVWVCDAEGRNLYASESFLKLVGLTQEQCSDFGWSALLHPEDVERTMAAWKECSRAGGMWDIEHRFRGVDGQYHAILARGVPIKNELGHIVSWAGINLDISRLKQTEAALLESIAQFRGVFQSAAVGIVKSTGEGRIQLVNDAFCRMLGRTRNELVGHYVLEFTHPDDRQANAEFIRRALAGEIKGYGMEKRYLRGNGSVLWVNLNVAEVTDEAGRLLHSIAVVADISERKAAEERLMASLKEKEVLLKEIHHRVKNNLQIVSSLVSLQADSLGDERLSDVLGDVRDRVRSMAMVHEKLYQSERLAEVDFAGYVESMLHSLWRAHGDAASTVRLKLAVEPVALSVEPAVHCGLILNELATNALKHAFPAHDGGEVTVALTRGEAGVVRLSVRDNGAGLPSGLDWRQAKSLGLHLVRMLTSQLRGTVEVESAPGAGTEFRVQFTVKEQGAEA